MDATVDHLSTPQLEAGLAHIREAPADDGVVRLIVARPSPDDRTVLDSARLDTVEGLVGDNWLARGNSRTPDGSADPLAQVTIMNARATALLAVTEDRWPLAGDQLYVDLDISTANLPAGSRIAIGDAVLEVTPKPHTGCAKFRTRFGEDAMRFVNSPEGRELNLRGINARVVEPGTIHPGDKVTRRPI